MTTAAGSYKRSGKGSRELIKEAAKSYSRSGNCMQQRKTSMREDELKMGVIIKKRITCVGTPAPELKSTVTSAVDYVQT